MADARTTLGGPSIGVGGGSSYGRRDTSGHERVQAQRAEANIREQEARRLGTWKEGVGVMSKQQLAAEARDKSLWNQNIAARNKQMGIDQSNAPQISATDFVHANRINVPAANARGAAEMAKQIATEGGRGERGAMSPTIAKPLEGVVQIAPQYRVKGESPFGYAGTPVYKEGQMVRATSAPITDATGRQTGIAGTTQNNWQQAVVNKYGDIGIAGTPMNRAYVQAVKAQTGEFDPMKLAESISKQIPSKTERTGELVRIDPTTGRRIPPPPPLRHLEVENFVPRSVAASAVQPPSSPSGPIVATQTPTTANRQNWLDRALTATPKEMSEFETRLQAQNTLPGQMLETIKHPITALRSYLNTDTTPSQVGEQAIRQQQIVNPAYERAERLRAAKGD